MEIELGKPERPGGVVIAPVKGGGRTIAFTA